MCLYVRVKFSTVKVQKATNVQQNGLSVDLIRFLFTASFCWWASICAYKNNVTNGKTEKKTFQNYVPSSTIR